MVVPQPCRMIDVVIECPTSQNGEVAAFAHEVTVNGDSWKSGDIHMLGEIPLAAKLESIDENGASFSIDAGDLKAERDQTGCGEQICLMMNQSSLAPGPKNVLLMILGIVFSRF